MLNWTQRAVDAVCRAGLALGATATAGIFILLAASSIKRYLGGTPVPFTEELAGLLFVVASLAAVPYGVASGQHIRLLLVWRLLPARAASALAVAGDLVGALVLGVLARQMISFAEYSREVGSRTEISELLLWPWMYVMPASLCVLGLAMTVRALTRFIDVRKGHHEALDAGRGLD